MQKLVNGVLYDLMEEEIAQNAIDAEASAAEYLDGIVKGDTAQVNKYIADCLAVKAAHPKGV